MRVHSTGYFCSCFLMPPSLAGRKKKRRREASNLLPLLEQIQISFFSPYISKIYLHMRIIILWLPIQERVLIHIHDYPSKYLTYAEGEVAIMLTHELPVSGQKAVRIKLVRVGPIVGVLVT